MDRQIWKGRIISALDDMADEQFQRRAWTGKGPEVSSLVEVICGLFDDALLLEYVDQYSSTLPDEILSDIKTLELCVDRLDKNLDTLPELEVIDNPEWVKIRGIAQRLKTAFERDSLS